MRKTFWSFDKVNLDFEDREVQVTAIHILTGTEIVINFRLQSNQMKGSAKKLRDRIEVIATDRVLDLASYLETFERN